MLTYLWDIAVGVCIDSVSDYEEMMGGKEKAAHGKWAMEGFIYSPSDRCFKEVGDEFYRVKPSR
jgi:hypothetical protein